ncbi:MAG: ABC transporter substrate-binding protein, partial [Clostridium sp.]
MKKGRSIVSIVTAISLIATVGLTFQGCNKSTTSAEGSKPYIAVVAKGFQFQYWQVVMDGANKAADELGVEITFDGPATESDIGSQVTMVNSALAKNPVALALAALDTDAVISQLDQAKEKNIPVIGFDSGIPNAPEGSVAATAATDSYKAAEIAADKLFAESSFVEKVKAATTTSPVVIAVLSQDATSDSIIQRTKGYIEKMKKNIEGVSGFEGSVDISGQTKYTAAATSEIKVKIVVNVPPTTAATDVQQGAVSLLKKEGIIAIYGSNQGATDGILSASSDGSDFNKTDGKYKDIIAVGFDAGKGLKTAVAKGWFLGAITQDPYSIGYNAVKLAFEASEGEDVSDVDTGAKWYDKTNMNDSD